MPTSLLVHLILLCSLILPPYAPAQGSSTPPLTPFSDDLAYRGLENALNKSCRYYETAPERTFDLCGQRLTGHELSHSYRQIMGRLREGTAQDIDFFLSENFTSCRPTSLLVTGYFTPVLAGSLTPSPIYRFPLYALPDQEQLQGLSRAAIGSGEPLTGHEIAYLSDPVDLFFLHVQGSGVIHLPDGSRRLASYAGNNGRPYTSIGKILIQDGKLRPEEVSLATIHAYLSDHPEQRDQILNQNERFIYFRLSAPEASDMVPVGSLGSPLTPGRSVAMDNSHYPPGILGVLTGRRPLVSENGTVIWQPFSRLVTHQDSGAAIKGRHRLDLYVGRGQKAGAEAGLMKEKGSFAILIPNLSLRQVHSTIGSSKNVAQSPKQTVPPTAQVEKRSP